MDFMDYPQRHVTYQQAHSFSSSTPWLPALLPPATLHPPRFHESELCLRQSKFSHSWQGTQQPRLFNLHINKVQIKFQEAMFKLSGFLFATRTVRVQYLLSHRFMRKCLCIDKQFCNKCIFNIRVTRMFRTCLNDLVFYISAQKNSSYKSVVSENCTSRQN